MLDCSCIYFKFMLIELLNLFICFYNYLAHSFNVKKCQLFNSVYNKVIIIIISRDWKIGASFDPQVRKGLTLGFIRPLPPE